MANGRRSVKDQAWSNWKPTHIDGTVTRGFDDRPNPMRNEKNEDVAYLNLAVQMKVYGEEEKDVHFLRLTFFNSERGNYADAIMENFGEDRPFGPSTHVSVIPGDLSIETYWGKLGSKNEPFEIEIDGESYSSEDCKMKGWVTTYNMIPQGLSVRADTNFFGEDSSAQSIFYSDDNDDSDDDDDRRSKRSGSGSRNKRSGSSSNNRRSKRRRDEDPDDGDGNDGDADEQKADAGSDDGDNGADDSAEEKAPRRREERRGSGRTSARRSAGRRR